MVQSKPSLNRQGKEINAGRNISLSSCWFVKRVVEMVKLEKKRYLLLRVETLGSPLSQDEFKHAAYEAVFSLLGEEGAGRAALQPKAFDEKLQKGIVKCSLSRLEKVIAALAAKTSFKGKKIALRLEKISGAIGKLV